MPQVSEVPSAQKPGLGISQVHLCTDTCENTCIDVALHDYFLGYNRSLEERSNNTLHTYVEIELPLVHTYKYVRNVFHSRCSWMQLVSGKKIEFYT